ncbi:FliM/FliN family flagellar motor switch protein [Paracoccus sp. M683]|uniref:FliM/FliN family flagellar motor switch protein n=1 Tax=Paracoccus sp. M683 TaxID=2594268 RepID=UPI00117E2044|nr:FliM/FliN family flagellar motor C-terminal domain-containing protein [Paracoccus sp. M683]TRW97296.1 FliM/FliN family flagellar motor switch protein [Paracoccus sp. M683]
MTEMDAGRLQDEGGGQGVLRRLLLARDQARLDHGAAQALPRPQPVTARRAAITAVARAMDQLYQLPVSTLELQPAAITLAEMAELLPQPALLSVVEGAGDAIGVVAICPDLMTALIEMQTLGRLTARPVEARRATRSDAIICADFVNKLLEQLGQEITQVDGFETFGGFRYASFLDDQRPLLLMLDDSPYRSLRYRLRFGQNPEREGQIFVALPQNQAVAALPPSGGPTRPDRQAGTPPDAAPRPSGQGARNGRGVTEEGATARADGALARPVQDAPVEVVGVLCRRMMTLGDLRGLKAGQLLPLPRLDLSDTRLETRLGQVLATGKLGEADGYHAIRLRDAGAPPEASAETEGANDTAMRQPAPGMGETGSARQQVNAAPFSPRNAAEPPMADLKDPDGFRDPQAGDSGAVDGAMTVASQQKAAISG